jgi:hypothetical protein
MIKHFLESLHDSRSNQLKAEFQEKIYSDASKLIGSYKQEMRHGQGIYYFFNTEIFIGDWKNDLFDGKGSYIFATGERYTGMLKDGKKEGEGVYIYSNGNKYEGQWS